MKTKYGWILQKEVLPTNNVTIDFGSLDAEDSGGNLFFSVICIYQDLLRNIQSLSCVFLFLIQVLLLSEP